MDFEEIIPLINQVVVDRKGRPLKTVERIVLQGAWENATYTQIAETAVGYTEDYLKKDVGPTLWKLLTEVVGDNAIKVTKRNLRNVLQDWAQYQTQPSATANQPPAAAVSVVPEPKSGLTWWDLPPIDVSDFAGRQADLATLHQLIMVEQCRLVILWGLPGCGKTFLAAAIAQQLKQEFEVCCYISLLPDVQPEALLKALLSALGSSDVEGDQEQVLQQLEERRCLIILDGGEYLFAPGQLAGTYRADCGLIRKLLRRIAEHPHQSCVLWVGQEKPQDLALLEGGRVRSHLLTGFSGQEASQFLRGRGQFTGSDRDWQQLVDRYSGNPQQLKELAGTILNVYRGDVQRFLASFSQFEAPAARIAERLAQIHPQEQELLGWLALAQEPISLGELQRGMLDPLSTEVVQSLLSRGLGRICADAGPQIVVELMPFLRSTVLSQLVQILDGEIVHESLRLLHRLPLLWTTAPERVQTLQQQSLLEPLAQSLQQRYPETLTLAEKLHSLHRRVRSQFLNQPSYGAGNLIHLCQYLDVGLTGLDFSQLAVWHANLRRGGIQGVNFSHAHFEHTLFAMALGRDPVVAFSYDGELLAIGDDDGRLLLWEVATGKLNRVLLEDSPVPVKSLGFSPDRQWLAVGGENGRLYLWSLHQTYGPEEFYQGQQQAVLSLVFSPDGSWLATGEADGTLRIWDLASGACSHCLTHHRSAVGHLQVAQSGDRLVSCDDNQLACLWSPVQGELLATYQGVADARLYTAGFDASDDHQGALAAGSGDQCLIIWDLPSSRPRWILPATMAMLLTLEISPDGQLLACSHADNTVTVWSIASRRQIFTLSGFTAPVWTVTFSPDSRLLATTSDYLVRLWDLSRGDCLRSLQSLRYPVSALSFTQDGTQLMTGHEDAQLRLWQLDSKSLGSDQYSLNGTLAQRLHSLKGHSQSIRVVTTSPHRVLASSDGQSIRLWHQDSGVCLRGINQAEAEVIALSADGKWLVGGSEDGSLLVWNLAQESPPRRLLGHQTSILALAITPDSARVISSSRDRSLKLWCIDTGQELSSPEGSFGHIQTVSLSPDGTQVLGASNDGGVYWWQLPDLALVGSWRHPDNQMVCQVLYGTEGQPLAIVSDTCTLTAWAVLDNQPVAVFQGHTQEIWQVCTSPDGQRIASASLGEEIRIWRVATGSCEQILHPDRPYEGVKLHGAEGLSEPERLMLKSLGAAVT